MEEELWYDVPMSLEVAREKLLGEIAAFLEERKEQVDDGWTEVTDRELRGLSRILSNLVVLKWARDVDGDLPIRWQLYDKTRYEYVLGLNLPRDNPSRCIKMLAGHLMSVSQRLDIYVRIRAKEADGD
jgi:hypothetical protein